MPKQLLCLEHLQLKYPGCVCRIARGRAFAIVAAQIHSQPLAKIKRSVLPHSLFFATLLTLAVACRAADESPANIKTYPAAEGLSGKVFVGYQGWYRTPGDGSGLGWKHYETYEEKFEPGQVGIDYWPDLTEFPEEETQPTPFTNPDGSAARVFSSQNPNTVQRHFKWMAEYGIDGAFLQRFVVDVVGFHHQSDRLLPSNNVVLDNVQKAANRHKRAFALMYDLTGLPNGEMHRVVDDWKALIDSRKILRDPAYLKDEGKPVIAIWGVGFNDDRKYTLEEVQGLIDFLRDDPKYGGCSIILGVPAYWRTQDRDTLNDPEFLKMLAKADVLLPWFVGRFGGSETALRLEKELYGPDQKWCTEHGVKYLPVLFPGFSWANRYAHKKAKFDHSSRENGLFLWSQAVAVKRAGANMVYIAMFDEMDEGTQIFKTTNTPPVGASRFLTYAPEEPDFYLRLTGSIRKLLNNQISASSDLPNIDRLTK